MSSDNPYAPPRTAESPVRFEDGSRYYVAGGLLMVRDGAILPNRCIKTNQPVEPGISGARKKVALSWCNPAWYLLLLLNLIIMLIVVLLVSKRAKIEVAISSGYRQKKLIWGVIWAILLFGGIALIVDGIIEEAGGEIALGGLTIIVGLIGLLVNSRYLVAKNHHEGLFSVKGCHPDFLAELLKHQKPSAFADRIIAVRK